MGHNYYSIEVDKDTVKPGEGIPRRNPLARKGTWITPPGKPHVTTIYELMKEGCKEFGPQKALGQRPLIKLHVEEKEVVKTVAGEEVKEKKKWQYFEMGQYKFNTFDELHDTIMQVGAGLLHIGLKPGHSRFHIYASTCKEWLETAIGCTSQNITFVTAYDTLGIEGLKSSIRETETEAILSDPSNLSMLVKVLPECPSIKIVVYRELGSKLEEPELKAIEELKKMNLKVYSFDEIVEFGKKNSAEPHPPTPDDIACIMYTSGSTGTPKGVVLTQKNVIAGVTGAVGSIGRDVITPKDTFLAILPLAHIFEFTVEISLFYWGAAIGYGTPKTVSDVNMRNSNGDIKELRPTLLVAVPAVFETIKKGIISKVNKMSSVTQSLFWSSFALKAKLKQWGLPTPLVDSLVFKKIKDQTGGRLRYFFNGGASLSRETRIFMDVCLAPPLMGYGMTETNAMAAIMPPSHFDLDSTGSIVPAVTMKFVDVPEANYYAKNGQGEILVKGGCVFGGYFKNEKETKEVLTDDGWLKTGDIGEWTANGNLRIIDRKKNLVKTRNGEYLALEYLESIYRSNLYIANLCIYANDDHIKPVAVIVPNIPAVKELCSELGVKFHDDVASEPKVKTAILKSIQDTGRSSGLKPVEILAGITFSEEEWTPQNGFVTSAQKVQRRKIRDANKKGLDEAFSHAG